MHLHKCSSYMQIYVNISHKHTCKYSCLPRFARSFPNEEFQISAPSHGRKCHTHGEIFSKSCQIKPKSDCIYHFPIDLEPNGRPFAVPNQSGNGKYNRILV